MCKKFISNLLFITFGIILICLDPILTNAKDIYKWTDENGKIHFTDNPALVPHDSAVEIEIIEEVKEKRSEDQIRSNLPTPTPSDNLVNTVEEEAIRHYWRSRALEIDNEEQQILGEISLTRNLMTYKKREVDYLLTNGYFADRSILELRNLEDRLKRLEFNLALVEPEREELREEARRAGIPPGYLRP